MSAPPEGNPDGIIMDSIVRNDSNQLVARFCRRHPWDRDGITETVNGVTRYRTVAYDFIADSMDALYAAVTAAPGYKWDWSKATIPPRLEYAQRYWGREPVLCLRCGANVGDWDTWRNTHTAWHKRNDKPTPEWADVR